MRSQKYVRLGKNKEKLKQKFAALTDNDLLYLEGMENEMITKLALSSIKPNKSIQNHQSTLIKSFFKFSVLLICYNSFFLRLRQRYNH
jgi:hypothetical protein